MTRKEMIVAAVLVNAGLLIVLFASALKSGAEGESALVKESSVIEKATEVVAHNQEAIVVGSEVDRAVQTLAAAQAQPISSESVNVSVGASNPFVDDIKAITTSDSIVSTASAAPVVQTLVAPIMEQKSGHFVEVKVKKGDMLEKIARHHHSTVTEIMKANNLTSSNLRIGQVLKVPQKEGAVTQTVASTSTQEAEKWYVVKKGDSAWTIATKHHMKVEDLLRLNQMDDKRAKRLQPGDKIRVQ